MFVVKFVKRRKGAYCKALNLISDEPPPLLFIPQRWSLKSRSKQRQGLSIQYRNRMNGIKEVIKEGKHRTCTQFQRTGRSSMHSSGMLKTGGSYVGSGVACSLNTGGLPHGMGGLLPVLRLDGSMGREKGWEISKDLRWGRYEADGGCGEGVRV